jgi:hypothetical protein
MYRKHIITKAGDKYPFYSWQCLTISLKGRDIDLVIHDDEEMDKLLKYLLFRMNTFDGYKDSAACLQLTEMTRHHIMLRTLFKFKILRARQKISFIAFK